MDLKPRISQVFINSKPYAGKLQITISTDPTIPLEDFIRGDFDREYTKVTYEFWLLPDNDNPIRLDKGSIKFTITAMGERIDISIPPLPLSNMCLPRTRTARPHPLRQS